MFHASIADNLRFGRPDATDAEIESAARAAQIHELISSLPQGYQTVVGERGYRFSGGEKQRLAIARMILRNPPVLVLDEATSAVDPALEMRINRALEKLMSGRTSVTIAHRLTTAEAADDVIVIDAGRIVQRGPNRTLMAQPGTPYDRLYQSWIAQQGR